MDLCPVAPQTTGEESGPAMFCELSLKNMLSAYAEYIR